MPWARPCWFIIEFAFTDTQKPTVAAASLLNELINVSNIQNKLYNTSDADNVGGKEKLHYFSNAFYT